jgi:hypothetical protein
MQLEFIDMVRDHSDGQGAEFIFVDEMSKNDHSTACRYGRSLSGECADFIDNFVHSDWYSLVAAIIVEGYVAAQVVAGSYDAVEFYDFIAEQVVCQPLFIFPFFVLTFPRSQR